MTPVPFIHFYLPNGRREEELIDLGDEVAPKLQEIQAAGCRLTAEVLSSGLCSFCVEHPQLGDYDMTLANNGPDVPIKITEMLLRFDSAKFQKWKALQNS